MWPGVGALTQYGYLGVNMFFVISGFVILMTAWGRTVETFAISRVTRLFPGLLVSVALPPSSCWRSGRRASRSKPGTRSPT